MQQKLTVRRPDAPCPKILSLDLSLCHQAKEVFYYNYIAGESKSYSFMQKYCSMVTSDDHLSKSIDAVSLAYLSYQKRSECAQAEAQLQYIDALKLVGKALRSSEVAKKDSTLLSILLLDLYEKITNKERQYDGAWAAHIKGAFSLVQLRGKEQYCDTYSLPLLIRLTTNIMISCVTSGHVVPDEVVALRTTTLAAFSQPSDPMWRESDLMFQYAHLRSKVKHKLLSDNEIVEAAKHLDMQFLSLSEQIRSSWQHKTVYVDEKSPHHYEPHHHVYPNAEVCQVWNVLRFTRIFLCELILSHGLKYPINPTLGPTQASLEQEATGTIDEMGREICATVPQYIDDSFDSIYRDGKSTDILSVVPIQSSRISLARKASPKQYLPCYRLIFPLYIAAQSPTTSKAVQLYAMQQLRFMVDHHGIENALAVANVLESGERNPWRVYNLLGSYAFVC